MRKELLLKLTNKVLTLNDKLLFHFSRHGVGDYRS